MSATKAQILRAIDGYKEAILADVERRCEDYCEELVWSAINFRRRTSDAHDFTGNLLGSIVVGLYKNRQPVAAFYSAEKGIAKAIQPKMSSTKKGRRRKYFYDPDYSGSTSVFRAEIKTNEGWGEEDARKFFQSYRPTGKNIFDIVVAYTVEYAKWIEMERMTTGIFATYQNAKSVGTTILRLPQK